MNFTLHSDKHKLNIFQEKELQVCVVSPGLCKQEKNKYYAPPTSSQSGHKASAQVLLGSGFV